MSRISKKRRRRPGVVKALSMTVLLGCVCSCGRGGGGGGSTPLPTSNIRLDTDDPSGVSVYPQIACSGKNIYVVWSDGRDINMDIYFNSSSDGGVTWRSSDIRLDTDAPGTAGSVKPRIACSGSNVYVTWADGRSGLTEIYFNSSKDGGDTWQASDVRLNSNVGGALNTTYPCIVCDGDNVYVTWPDNRNGQRDIYFNRSADGGDTWLAADVRLDTDTAGAALSDYPTIACNASNVYVTWSDARNGDADVYFNSSSDGGATWRASDIRIDHGTAGTSAEDSRVACLGSDVFVVWLDMRNGQYDVYFNSSSNGGTTWRPGDIRLDTDIAGAASSIQAQMACSASGIFVAWQDARNGKWDIYFNASADGGNTWRAADVRLDTDATGSHDSRVCGIACWGDDICVAWEDDRNGESDIYYNKSTDAGLTWMPQDTRLDDDHAGAATSANLDLAASDTAFYAIWEDCRRGSYDIFFDVAE